MYMSRKIIRETYTPLGDFFGMWECFYYGIKLSSMNMEFILFYVLSLHC